MPGRDPICGVNGCSSPTDGILTISSPNGGFRVSACTHHGRRAISGELLVFDVLGSKYALGGSTTPTTYDELLRR
jgi:hypothetical protein